MKILLTKDMDARRVKAKQTIDGFFKRKRLSMDINAEIHALKGIEAINYASGIPSPMLDIEAKAFGIPTEELAKTIMSKVEESSKQLGLMEVERQEFHARIKAAKTPQQLEEILAEVGMNGGDR